MAILASNKLDNFMAMNYKYLLPFYHYAAL